MYKTEIICGGCEGHYIVVTKHEEQINFCPFCSEPFSELDQENPLAIDEEESEL